MLTSPQGKRLKKIKRLDNYNIWAQTLDRYAIKINNTHKVQMYLQSTTLDIIVTCVKRWNISISSYDNTADYSWIVVIAGQVTR